MPKRDLVDIAVFLVIVVVLAALAVQALGTQISFILTMPNSAL